MNPGPDTLAELMPLKQALHDYLAAVPRQREPHPPDLMAHFAQLDELTEKLGPFCPPQLRHYLHQKSYRKAHLYLQGEDAEDARGNCGR